MRVTTPHVAAGAAALIAGALAFGPPTRPAQPAQPDAVPRELAEALIGASGWDEDAEATLVVGRAPDRFPAPLPANARPLGGVTRGRFVREVVATSPDASGAARTAYLRALDAAGWRPLAPERVFGGGGGGFVSSVIYGPRTGGDVRCGPDDATLLVRTAPRAGGGSRLHVQVTQYPRDARRSGLCAAARQDRLGHGMVPSPLPWLQAPPGGTLRAQGSGGSDEEHHATAVITGVADAAAAAAHFAGELAAAGWTIGPAVVADSLAARRVTSPADSAGRRWSGALWVTPTAGTACAGSGSAPDCGPRLAAAVFVAAGRAKDR